MQRFPNNFLWGSATASYQVEGGIENNDWADAARSDKVPVCGKATDHYNKYESDFDIAKSLGHNAHRLSIEWSRIEPEEGKFDEIEIEHYRKVLRALKTRGIEPFVTLWHFTLPLWFSKKGGFENKEAPQIFARYCECAVSKLGNEAKYWITINEPLVWASIGYAAGKWPPFKRNIFRFHFVSNILINAHKLSYRKIKAINPNLQIGIAKHNICFDYDFKPWNIIASVVARWYWNHRFLGSIKNYQDFIGLNFYNHKRFGKGLTYPKTEMGWDIYPLGIFKVLAELSKYKKPIYITENGIADAGDIKRADFIKDHLTNVLRAVNDGIPVRGYFYWSLLDNYEWAYGFEKRFGLVEVNYNTLERKIRPSALVYKRIIETGNPVLTPQ